MDWKDIKLNKNQTGYSFDDKPLFGKSYQVAMNFHKEGVAAVQDESRAYHIDMNGEPIYTQRYLRTFGYYHNKAAVTDSSGAYHIDLKGKSIYKERYQWTGNFQQDICTVKTEVGAYFHIDSNGKKLYSKTYKYAGDFRENIACVQLKNDLFTHIYKDGSSVHNKYFEDLNVYHKGYACAKDESGWCHIDLEGKPIYKERYLLLEPFYNGAALASDLQGKKLILNDDFPK